MSVIRKKPFIESVVEDLTDSQKSALLAVMNGDGAVINASFLNMPDDDVKAVVFQFNDGDSKTGILIQSAHYDVLICYHRFQDLLMIKLDMNTFKYEKVNEYLDIEELRRVLAPKTIYTTNIKEMSDAQLNALKVGDSVVKITGNLSHCYVVSYKENYHGICMTYCAAGLVETQSYDYTEGHWVYNSEDKWTE